MKSTSNIFNDSEKMYSQPLLANSTPVALNQIQLQAAATARYSTNFNNFNQYNDINNNNKPISSNYQQYQYQPPENRYNDKSHSSQSQFRVRSYRVLPPVSADHYSRNNFSNNYDFNPSVNNNNNNFNNSYNRNNNSNLNLLTNNNNIGI